MARTKAVGGKAPRRYVSAAKTDQFQAREKKQRRDRVLQRRKRVALRWRRKIPEAKRMNFDDFKNRYNEDQREYAIEVLVGGADTVAQIRRERTARRKEAAARMRQSSMFWWAKLDQAGPSNRLGLSNRTAKAGVQQRDNKKTAAAAGGKKAKKEEKPVEMDMPSSEAYVDRVRIQSLPVLGHLTRVLNESEKRTLPRTFCRPFKPLIYFQPQMKKALAELEEKFGHVEDDFNPDDNSDRATTPGEDDIVKVAGADAQQSAESQDNDDDDSDAEEGGSDDDSDIDGRSDRDVEDEQDSDIDDDEDDDEDDVGGSDGDLDALMDSREALADMRCYVDFVDREILPLYTRFNESTEAAAAAPKPAPAPATDRKVRFDDLWHLFRVNDLVYRPSSAVAGAGGQYHELFRIYRVECPEPNYKYNDSDDLWWSGLEDLMPSTQKGEFTLFCYYIDWNGSGYGPVRHKFAFKSFPGEREIESLEVFPVRFMENGDEMLDSLTQRGRDFQAYLADGYQSYNAWTLTRNPPFNTSDPEEEILRDENRELMRHPEFVESHVIVDMLEAFQANPDWRPRFHWLSVHKSISCSTNYDDLRIQQWDDRGRGKLLFSTPEIIQLDDGVEMRQRRDNLVSDPFLKQCTEESRGYRSGTRQINLRDQDLALLPKRMFGYALRERRFVPLDISHLKPIVREQGVLENLKILRNYKDIVRGLVSSHFQRKELERRLITNSTEGVGQDLIQGKGRGLVILLHGVPGVGKTATAEAVAIEKRKPLFVITCGDLGLTPDEIESSLSNVFRLAHLWDCVLLLDEADVFLSQRTRLDMKRNALVSVFLRVLEYYNGLLFLTTNRVGTIDEAFKSRIHISLYYPPLNRVQTQEIFRVNVDKLRRIEEQRRTITEQPMLDVHEEGILEFATDHYNDNHKAGYCWNGRQIRNAFQIATGLAYNNYQLDLEKAERDGSAPPKAPVLDRKLFEKVQDATSSFDDYMRETKGWTDADLSHLLGERADYLSNAQPALPAAPVGRGGFEERGGVQYGAPLNFGSAAGAAGAPRRSIRQQMESEMYD